MKERVGPPIFGSMGAQTAARVLPMDSTSFNLQGFGCPDCTLRSAHMQGLGEAFIFTNLKDKLLTSVKAISFFSKPPGDIFPLVNTEKMMPAGTAMGSIIDYKEVDNGNVWLKANLVNPGWFKYDPSAVRIKDKQNIELTQKQKEEILFSVIKTAPGGAIAPVVKDVGEGVVDTIETGAQAVSFIGRYLKWILIGGAVVGGYVIYKKYVEKNIKS